MGCGDRSIAFFEFLHQVVRITVEKKRSMIKCREVEHAVSSRAPIPTPNRKETVTEKLMNCLICITVSEAQNLLTLKYNFEDNGAVIKMMMKGRSPTMRQHVQLRSLCVQHVISEGTALKNMFRV